MTYHPDWIAVAQWAARSIEGEETIMTEQDTRADNRQRTRSLLEHQRGRLADLAVMLAEQDDVDAALAVTGVVAAMVKALEKIVVAAPVALAVPESTLAGGDAAGEEGER